MCSAAYELIHTKKSITEVAFEYQYNTVEGFSRAFRKQYLVPPSVFRRQNRFSQLYPKIVLQLGDEAKKTYDLTDLSHRILSAKGTYILDVDIDHLMVINDTLGSGAGDIAIAETAARIERSSPSQVVFFRIGKDEFIVITLQSDLAGAQEIAKKILSFSGDPVAWNGGTFQFSVSVGVAKIPDDIKDSTPALDLARQAVVKAKRQRSSYQVL